MSKEKVIILLTNPLEIDNRVYNEAKSLADAGFEVTVYAWDREARYSNKIESDFGNIKVKRVLVKSSYGKGLWQVAGFLMFWINIFWRLLINEFDIVHCVDLNTLVPGFLAAKIKRKKVVYDSHEDFPAALMDGKAKILARPAEAVEKFILLNTDLVITVSKQIKDILLRRGAKEVFFIPTTKPLKEYIYSKDEIDKLKSHLDVKGKFVFLYLGLLYHHRNLIELIKIFKKYIDDDHVFIVGGYGVLEKEIKDLAKQCSNVKFIGRVLAKDISFYTKMADVVFAVNKSNSKNSNVTIPNKIFESIAAGKPIIGSNIGPLGEIIRENECGLVVNPDDAEKTKEAIELIIKDKNLYDNLVNNARKAQKRYNWEATGGKLVKEYKEISKDG